MKIQFNTDNNIAVRENYEEKLSALFEKELNRFSEQITRLEVHLSDENGSKNGIDDRKCLIEARLAGMNPIAVTEIADTHDNAVKGAISKLKSSLETIIGKLKTH